MGQSVIPKLHTGVLSPEQVHILKATAPFTKSWGAYLAGGLALGLQRGHRTSHDFDWFTKETISPKELERAVGSFGLAVKVNQNNEGTFLATLGNTDFSVFRYPYPVIKTFESGGCDIASLRDIGAMKLSAICQRVEPRDYVDLFEIVESLPLREIVVAWKTKYPHADHKFPLKALVYFSDVEKKVDRTMPKMLNGVTWANVRKGLEKAVERYFARGIER